MSQIHVPASAEPPPPEVPTSFVTDDGTAIPVNNILNLVTDSTPENNNNGIQDEGSGDTVTILLTNRIIGETTTTDATTQEVVLFPFNTNTGPGTYFFDFHTVAYNQTDALSAGYQTQFCVRWDGALGTLIFPQDYVTCEEGTMIDCDIVFVSTGVSSLTIEITGLAAKTISWQITGTYYYVE